MSEKNSFECPFASKCIEPCTGAQVTNVTITPGGMYDDHANVTLKCATEQTEASITIDNPGQDVYIMAKAFRETRTIRIPN